MAAIALADAIEELRHQLTLAMKRAEGKELRFKPKEIDLELKLQVEDKMEGDAKVTLWSVLSLGGSAATTDTTVHTLRLKLEPIPDDGEIAIGRH